MIHLQSPSLETWRAFVDGRSPNTASDELVRSWERSVEAGVNVHGEAVAFVDNRTLAECRARQDELRHHSLDVMEEIAGSLSESGYVAVLADDDGVVLDRRGGGQFLDAAQQAQLVEGASWAEGRRGTNAIGTALHERAEVTVHGRAHLHSANHGLVCYSQPLFDPRGDMRGVLDLTSHADAAAPLALAAVRAAARRIQERWTLDFSKHLRPFESVVMKCADPVALVDLTGTVRLMNDAMAALAQGNVRSFQRLSGMSLEVLAARVRRGDGRANGEGLLEVGTRLSVDWIEDDHGKTSAALVTVPSVAPTGRSTSSSEPVDAFVDMIGTDRGFRLSLQRAEQLADTELPIVLLADTGTGKELMARGLHDASRRRDEPFIAVNCAGFTDSLLQSELFGYADGAFTGAAAGGRKGLLEAAHKGTLFLDEVADLPPRAQASLLRFLESGTFNRVGETKSRRADVRLISATCRDLRAAVKDGSFRKDLFFRIKGVALTIPSLNERDDVAYLAERLLADLARKQGTVCPQLTRSARRTIARYDWPGNVRELKQSLQVALAMRGRSMQIDVEHLPPDVTEGAPKTTDDAGTAESALVRETRAAIEAADGNVSEAARALGVARSTIYRRLGEL